MTETTSLYRFYAADGALLYVGITRTLLGRLKQHSGDKPWFTEVSSITTEHLDSRERALAAEKAAIIAERPRYNVTHNHGRAASAPRTGRWRWDMRDAGITRQHDLFLVPEIEGSTIVEDWPEMDGEAQLWEWVRHLRRQPDTNLSALKISWFVEDEAGCDYGYAPFQNHGALESADPLGFLATNCWPVDVRNDEMVDWYKLPLRWDARFQEAAKALDWTPGKMQQTCPLRHILGARGVML